MSVSSSPFQRVKDSPTDMRVGIQTSTSWISVGTPTIKPSTTLSRPDSRRTRRAGAAAALRPRADGLVETLMEIPCLVKFRAKCRGKSRADRAVTRAVSTALLGGVQGLGLGFQVLHIDVAVLDERLKRRDHHVVGHGGQGIAVEELADVLGTADGLGQLLVQRSELGGIGALGGGDVGRVDRGVHILS